MVPHLPAKILAHICSRTQAFLRSCAEAKDISEVRFSYIDWDSDIDDLFQGIGTIINMPIPAHVMKITHGEEKTLD